MGDRSALKRNNLTLAGFQPKRGVKLVISLFQLIIKVYFKVFYLFLVCY